MNIIKIYIYTLYNINVLSRNKLILLIKFLNSHIKVKIYQTNFKNIESLLPSIHQSFTIYKDDDRCAVYFFCEWTLKYVRQL